MFAIFYEQLFNVLIRFSVTVIPLREFYFFGEVNIIQTTEIYSITF